MKYKVYWQTQRSPVATFYQGSQLIDFEEEEGSKEEAARIIQKSVWSNFREFSLDHIQIVKVEAA